MGPVALPELIGFLRGQFLQPCHHDAHDRFGQIIPCAANQHIPNAVIIALDHFENEISQPLFICAARSIGNKEMCNQFGPEAADVIPTCQLQQGIGQPVGTKFQHLTLSFRTHQMHLRNLSPTVARTPVSPESINLSGLLPQLRGAFPSRYPGRRQYASPTPRRWSACCRILRE